MISNNTNPVIECPTCGRSYLVGYLCRHCHGDAVENSIAPPAQPLPQHPMPVPWFPPRPQWPERWARFPGLTWDDIADIVRQPTPRDE